MLEYENQLVLDAVQESQLFIFAKGIATQRVLVHLFRLYASPENLVFILSASAAEEQYFREQLADETRVISISTEFNANERKELYANGGVFFITSRILVVDFLKEVVPAEKITGIIVLRAHNVIESSQEAFILRLFRTKNKTGFIKAFSHSPTAFLLGFSHLNSVMRCCFLANVSLWPRFHVAIKESLKAQESQVDAVIEIQLKLTEEMREIQSSLLDLVTWSVGELKRLVPALNDEDVTVETALTNGFEKIIRAHVDPVWNTISVKSKELLNDLKVFRLLLAQLTKADCVTFYSILCNYTSHEAGLKSSWVLSDSADKIISAARTRLKPLAQKEKSKEGKSTSSKKDAPPVFQPEIHPKWLALGEILTEINIKQEKTDDDEGKDATNVSRIKTIIFAEDIKTCTVLRDYLANGSTMTLAKIARNCENVKIELPPEVIMKLNSIHGNSKVDRAVVGGLGSRSKENQNDSDEDGNVSKGPTEVQITLTQIQRKYEDVEFLQTPVFIRPLKVFGDTGGAYGVADTLETLRPDVIIIFDPDLDLIRNIEIHRARVGASQMVRVFFLVFHNSIEEQIYLTGIQREKQAFERLIEEKANMVVPKEREGRDELNQDLWRDPTKASEVNLAGRSKRNMENVANNEREWVLVDMREFRSELPSLVHKRGIDLEPITLDVGDYILTPDICVERKSISDLIGSLNSGRLYKQAEAMGRHYMKPVLLIEHEQKSGSGRYKNDLAQIMPKLQLLTMNFPKLRLIWSPGAHYTSEVFHELKRGKPQPDAEKALSIMKEATGTHATTRFNPVSHGFLSKLPGIDSQNVYTLLNRCDTLDLLCHLSEPELAVMLENSAAASVLYTGLHSKLTLLEASEKAEGAAAGGKPGFKSKPGPASRTRKR